MVKLKHRLQVTSASLQFHRLRSSDVYSWCWQQIATEVEITNLHQYFDRCYQCRVGSVTAMHPQQPAANSTIRSSSTPVFLVPTVSDHVTYYCTLGDRMRTVGDVDRVAIVAKTESLYRPFTRGDCRGDRLQRRSPRVNAMLLLLIVAVILSANKT